MSNQKVTKNLVKYLTNLMKTVLDKDTLNKFTKTLNENTSELSNIISKPKSKKDPNAPKRPQSSFFLFCAANRVKFKSEHPEMKSKEVVCELARFWREDITEKEKKKYQTLATQEKERYKKEMLTYEPPPPELEDDDSGGDSSGDIKKIKSKKTGPKKGSSAYIWYCKKIRPQVKKENPTNSPKEITSKIGAMWKNLNEEEKIPYVDLATKDKLRYEKELKLDNIKIKTTGYVIFYEENLPVLQKDNPSMSSSQLAKKINLMWKSLSEKKKNDFNSRASGKTM